jgi:hypothetical protein
MPAQHDSLHLFPRLPILLLVNKYTGVIYADFNATCMLILSPARGARPTDYDSGVIRRNCSTSSAVTLRTACCGMQRIAYISCKYNSLPALFSKGYKHLIALNDSISISSGLTSDVHTKLPCRLFALLVCPLTPLLPSLNSLFSQTLYVSP